MACLSYRSASTGRTLVVVPIPSRLEKLHVRLRDGGSVDGATLRTRKTSLMASFTDYTGIKGGDFL